MNGQAGTNRVDASVAVGHLLAEELRELEADGMIDRERTGKPPAPVMCSLTGYRYSLVRNEGHP